MESIEEFTFREHMFQCVRVQLPSNPLFLNQHQIFWSYRYRKCETWNLRPVYAYACINVCNGSSGRLTSPLCYTQHLSSATSRFAHILKKHIPWRRYSHSGFRLSAKNIIEDQLSRSVYRMAIPGPDRRLPTYILSPVVSMSACPASL